MTRLFLRFFVLLTVFLAVQFLVCAETEGLSKSTVLENDVEYLRISNVGTNLVEEIQSAQNGLAKTNQIDGTVLDLRFADGDDLDSGKTAMDLSAKMKLPLAILVNSQTRGAAAKLAVELRDAHDGLIFGSSTEVKPDIVVAVKLEDERKFIENPYGTLAQSETNSASSTNDLFSFIDHTTEADLVRAKIKDGDQNENTGQDDRAAEEKKPFIRDPVLARGVDFIKGLAALHLSHS